IFVFFFSSRRRHTRCSRDWSSDVCSSDLAVLQKLWRGPPADGHPFRVLAAEAKRWTAELRSDWEALGRPFEESLVDAAATAARELGGSDPDVVLCHQDFQGS